MNCFLEAVNGGDPGRIPVWFMRQAGRYLPEFREMRKKHGLMEMFRDPDMVERITFMPVEKVGVDAAILFSDILLPLASIGIKVTYGEGSGPSLSGYNSPKSLDDFHVEALGYPLVESIVRFRDRHPDTPLIGFAGGPVTLASYVLAGRTDSNLQITKLHMRRNRMELSQLLGRMVELIAGVLNIQIRAGCDVVQIFDSWAGSFSPKQFSEFYSPFLKEIREAVDAKIIYFSTCTGNMLEIISSLGFDIINPDWRIGMDAVRKALPETVGIQGNLDPSSALAWDEDLQSEIEAVISPVMDRNNYIFNLGHGVLPETNENTLKRIVEVVHAIRE